LTWYVTPYMMVPLSPRLEARDLPLNHVIIQHIILSPQDLH